VAFDVSAITDGDTEEFTTWVDQRITATLGSRYQDGAYNGGMSQRLGEEQLLTAVGKGVAASMMPWVTSAKNAQEVGAKQADAKEGYGKDEVAILLGFHHESKGTMVQLVWNDFRTNKKNMVVCRRILTVLMSEWARNNGVTADTSAYIEDENLKAIMNLQFNPGDGAANLPTLHKGLSLLTCRGRTMTEVEAAKERDETMARTEKTDNWRTSPHKARAKSGLQRT
jgi:hypothetical protein